MVLDEFSPMVLGELRKVKAPGCSIALVDAQGKVESRGFGLADVRTGREATSETIYHLFSVTKLFTATRVMQLVEEGSLSLDAQIADFVSSAPGGVTIEHLLSHSSGLRDVTKAVLAFHVDPKKRPTTAQALSCYSTKLRGRPGGKASYQNINYMLLAAALENLTGRLFEEDLVENVLEPLEMSAGLCFLDPSVRNQAATGYFCRFDLTGLLIWAFLPSVRTVMGKKAGAYTEILPYDLDSIPVGGLVTSVEDAAKFVADQLAPESRLLSIESRHRMRQLVSRGKAGLVSAVGTGLGWKIGESPHGRYFNHEGGGPGFTAELRLYPELGLGIVMVINRMAMSCSRAAHRLCEAMVGRSANSI